MFEILTGALPVLAPPGCEPEVTTVAANGGSQVAADELCVVDPNANDVIFDLDDFWRVMGPPESPQGARFEDLPSVATVKGEETADVFSTDELLAGIGEQYMPYNSEGTESWKGRSESERLQLTDNSLQNPLSFYQNYNEQASFEAVNHGQPSNFHSMSHVVQTQGYLDLNATGKSPFDASVYCKPSDFEAENLFESTGYNYMCEFENDWYPSGDIVDKMHYAGQDQLSLMSCSKNVPLPKDEIKVDSRADHGWSNVKMEMNSVKMEKEIPNSTSLNKVLGYSSVFSSPSIKMETNSKWMGGEVQKTYQKAQDSTIKLNYVEDDSDPDSDICILEDMSAPAPQIRVTVDANSVVTSQFSTSRNPAVRTMTTHSRYEPNDERTIFRVALQDLTQPKSQANPPDGVLSVPLLKHQRIALSWMVNKETKSACCSGGILADDQGLGKTVSTIALILKERSLSSKCSKTNEKQRQIETLNLDDDDDVVFEAEPPQVNGCHLAKGRPSGGTLIVCPTSVMRQWSEELHNKVTREADLSVLVYYGGTRTKDPIELAKYDVVVTTYAIVSMEVPKQPVVNGDENQMDSKDKELSSFKKRKLGTNKNSSSSKKRRKGNDGELLEDTFGPLAQVGWFRVVLDEAQSIKNHRTQAARACWGLRAKRRWCLSGTPIQNSIDDLYSYFRFLRHEPYAVFKTFCDQLKAPINRSPRDGYKKIQAVLKTIMLRRTKGTFIDGEPIINLPPKTIELRKVEFSEEERAFYCKLEADSRAQFAEYAAAGTVKQNYVNILLMLLRLRQACDHPRLVKGFSSSSKMRSSTGTAMKLSREKQTSLLSCLEASLAICGVCSDPPEDAVVTACGHVFCHQCICEHLIGDGAQCPSKKCKTNLSMASVFSRATLRTALSESDQSGRETITSSTDSNDAEVSMPHSPMTTPQYSSKIDAALCILLERKSKVNDVVPEKTIVFSQWTGMLDLLEASLKDNNIHYRRLDGTMSVAVRDRAVKDFKSDPQVTVMIMSLKAASLGLNLVVACKVVLLDLWWNPTTEDQAIDRAHRIGQTSPVSVYRLTVKDTVEDRILALQERKRKMVSSAFGENETGTRQSRLTVDDLMYLFNVK